MEIPSHDVEGTVNWELVNGESPPLVRHMNTGRPKGCSFREGLIYPLTARRTAGISAVASASLGGITP